MKILTISDNVLPQLEDADFIRRTYADVKMIISCGDLPASYIDFISSVLNVPTYYVRGNHDTDYEPGNPGAANLHKRITSVGGLGFIGLEGSIRYSDSPAQYTEAEMYAMVIGLIPGLLLYRARMGRPVDVVVTHSPPRDIHDLPDPAHRGFMSFRLLMQVIQPRYLIHGHVNTYDRRKATVTQFGETQVININPVKVLDLDSV